MKKPVQGIIPPIVTPLTKESKLDVAGLERLVEHLISGGVHGIFILGTTGEAPSLTYEMRKEVIDRVCSQVAGRTIVMTGITDTSFEGSLHIAEHAHKAGCDSVVVAPPYYIPITQNELIIYFEHLIPRLPLPLMLYNMPGYTKLHMEIETVQAAANLGAIGIKDSSGDMLYLFSLIDAFRQNPDFAIISGTELFIPETIIHGGHGAVCGGANLYPRLFVDYYEASANRDYATIEVLRQKVMHLYNTIYNVSPNASKYTKGIKCALSVMGICSDYMAMPLQRYNDAERQAIRQYLEEMSDYSMAVARH